MDFGFTQSIFQARSYEHASNWTLLLEENRNHVWSDLSRLVVVECKNGLSFTKSMTLIHTLWVSQFVHTTTTLRYRVLI